MELAAATPTTSIASGSVFMRTGYAKSMFCGKVCRMKHHDQRKGRQARNEMFGFAVFAVFAFLVVTPITADAQQQALTPVTDTAAVDRGQKLLVDQCGFCHGANARGGSSGPDLTRSTLVQSDEDGRQLGEFLALGRPDRGMPTFDLPRAQVADIAAFLHSSIYLNANRRLYKILDIVVGDAKAGEAYFSGAGRCGTCHSPSRDLKGVGAKYEPATLQGRLLLPRGRERAAGEPSAPLYMQPTAIKVTVTPASGEAVTGGLVRLTDFEVTLYDAGAGRMRSWLRNGDTRKVVVTDPLQAHVDQLTKWTDADMHNMTAYLVSLK
jgi:cytochrome c oxidase cbb3-type subunit 3